MDETNAAIGAVRSFLKQPELDGWLARIQEELFVLGAFLASRHPPDQPQGSLQNIDAVSVQRLEKAIDAMTVKLAPLKHFVLPGGSQGAALLHLARTVCRRAERAVVSLSQQQSVSRTVVIYLNRLSDALFVMAREANRKAGARDVTWKPADQPKREV